MPWSCGTVWWLSSMNEQGVVREVVEQRGRRLAGQAAGEMARVVLDAVAVADLADHLEVEHGALLEALRLDQLALLFEFGVPPLQLAFGWTSWRCSRVSSLIT